MDTLSSVTRVSSPHCPIGIEGLIFPPPYSVRMSVICYWVGRMVVDRGTAMEAGGDGPGNALPRHVMSRTSHRHYRAKQRSCCGSGAIGDGTPRPDVSRSTATPPKSLTCETPPPWNRACPRPEVYTLRLVHKRSLSDGHQGDLGGPARPLLWRRRGPPAPRDEPRGKRGVWWGGGTQENVMDGWGARSNAHRMIESVIHTYTHIHIAPPWPACGTWAQQEKHCIGGTFMFLSLLLICSDPEGMAVV